MLSFETFTAFFAASFILALAPGPDNIFVLTQSAMHGRKAGIIITLGLCTGLVFHTAAVTLGIAALLQASAIAFTFLKIAGACYLLYLAWQAFHSSAAEINFQKTHNLGSWQACRRGIIMNITNPKVSIFFMAYLPQFADPGRGSVAVQIMLLGLVFIAATLLVFGTISLLAGFAGNRLNRSKKVQRLINRIAGIVFAGLAIKLATAHR
ncbi:MAG: LysE family translocator [Syntrophales bacterium]|jgi:threonine/homoserine/homoserine lactone efflux protein|nr:LysE family translocator [Syntrophales bacterium]MDY0044705.1 LysE family translocator [Syntrophales bacterium]